MSDDLNALTRLLGDRYLIERELGRGGMGAVYLARDRRLDRPVALKVLPPEYAAQPDLRERFLRETRLAAGFSHPNIVPVFAIEDTEEVLAFAMGFVEGESLASRVAREGPLSRRDAVRLLQDVGYALAYAHGRDVVHRDIKPDNIMIERATGRALVMDFGIARAIAPVTDKPGLTRVGEVVGTPEYMSPEQAAGEAVDGRADLYSLGLVAWFALAGRTAVTGESTQRVLVKQLTEAVPPISSLRADLPATLCEVVDRCCAKEADDRFATAEAVVEALEATQLMTPEVPVAMRLLAPELTSASTRAAVAILLLAYGVFSAVKTSNATIFTFAVVAAASAWVAVVSAFQELRRLRRSGYTVAELQRLLWGLMVERNDERQRRATDLTLLSRRRRRVIIASLIMLLELAALIWIVRDAKVGGNVQFSGTRALIMFYGALVGFAIAVSVLLASPFRRPIAERLFTAVWLGAIGRTAMRMAGGKRENARDHTGASSAGARSVPTPRSMTAAVGSRTPDTASLTALTADVRDLRARVETLESER